MEKLQEYRNVVREMKSHPTSELAERGRELATELVEDGQCDERWLKEITIFFDFHLNVARGGNGWTEESE